MPFHPNEARTDRLPVVQRVERAKQRRRRRVVTVAVLATVLIIAVAARAWAWTLSVSGQGICNTQTGQYDLVWTLDNTSEPEAASVTGDLSATVPAHGTTTVSESVPGSTSGSVQRTIRINWPSDQANLRRVGTIEGLAGGCEKPAPPTTTTPTTAPPVTTPAPDDGDDFAGTATDQTRTPRTEPTPDDSPELGTPDQPGQLPFTDSNRNQVLLGTGLVFFAAGLALLLVARRREAQLSIVERAVARAMRKPYRGPRERLR